MFISLFIQQLLCDHNVSGSVLETKNSNVYKIIYLMEETDVHTNNKLDILSKERLHYK